MGLSLILGWVLNVHNLHRKYIGWGGGILLERLGGLLYISKHLEEARTLLIRH